MDLNIAKITDIEINNIINTILVNDNYEQVDSAYIEVKTPFQTNPNTKNIDWQNKLGFVLYPELLTYYVDSDWVTIPWICIKLEFEGVFSQNETELINLIKWFSDELTNFGYQPFRDEDSFAGCSTKKNNRNWVEIKMYINPSFPEGYWSNHTL